MAGCFPRRETRETFREVAEAMLMGVARARGGSSPDARKTQAKGIAGAPA